MREHDRCIICRKLLEPEQKVSGFCKGNDECHPVWEAQKTTIFKMDDDNVEYHNS